jgi:nucleoid-associated protein YgaU
VEQKFVIRSEMTPEGVFRLVCESDETGYEEGDFLDDYDREIAGWWNHNEDRLDKFCLEVAEDFLNRVPEYRPTNREVLAYALRRHMEDWMEEENERCSYDNAE